MGGKIKCPVCREEFDLESDLEIGDTTGCPGCAAGLRIVKLNPIRVEEVITSSGDYDDEEEGDYS